MNWLRFQNPERILASKIEALFKHVPQDQETAYTLDRLQTLTSASSVEELTLVVRDLVDRGKLRPIFRVEVPENHQWLKDFSSSSELPHEIYDERSGRNIEVTPRNVRILFSAAKIEK